MLAWEFSITRGRTSNVYLEGIPEQNNAGGIRKLPTTPADQLHTLLPIR